MERTATAPPGGRSPFLGSLRPEGSAAAAPRAVVTVIGAGGALEPHRELRKVTRSRPLTPRPRPARPPLPQLRPAAQGLAVVAPAPPPPLGPAAVAPPSAVDVVVVRQPAATAPASPPVATPSTASSLTGREGRARRVQRLRLRGYEEGLEDRVPERDRRDKVPMTRIQNADHGFLGTSTPFAPGRGSPRTTRKRSLGVDVLLGGGLRGAEMARV